MYWHEPTDNTPDGEGFWSVATYAETLEVLKDPATYSSVTGGQRPYGGTLLQDLAIAGQVLNMMDDPRHSQIRRLVSSGLTPRMIRRVEDDLRARARRLLDAVVPGEPFDFLVDIAAELPMQMICILLGVPESERHWLFEAIEPQFDFGGSRKASLSQLSVEEAGSRMYDYGQQLIASKRAEPTDDMLSVVANATVDDVDAPVPVGSRAVPVLQSAVQRRCGDDAQRRRGWAAGAGRASGAIARAACAISTCCRPRSRRWFGGPRRRRPSGAPPRATSRSADSRSRRGRRSRSGRARPTAMPACSTAPTSSTSPENPIRTWGLVRACTIAWAPIWPGWNCGCSSRSCCRGSAPCGLSQPVEWTRSNRHTGIRHLVVELLEER